jgi:hypothetical protein
MLQRGKTVGQEPEPSRDPAQIERELAQALLTPGSARR